VACPGAQTQQGEDGRCRPSRVLGLPARQTQRGITRITRLGDHPGCCLDQELVLDGASGLVVESPGVDGDQERIGSGRGGGVELTAREVGAYRFDQCHVGPSCREHSRVHIALARVEMDVQRARLPGSDRLVVDLLAASRIAVLGFDLGDGRSEHGEKAARIGHGNSAAELQHVQSV
jgi:hypothetical protein